MKTKLLLFFIFIFITCSSQSITDVHKIDTDLIITKIIESNIAKVQKNDANKIARQFKKIERSLTNTPQMNLRACSFPWELMGCQILN